MTKKVEPIRTASAASSASLATMFISGGGGTTMPSVDGTPATNAWSGVSSFTVTVSTTSASKILMVLIGYEHPTPTTLSITGVTATGLTFTKYLTVTGATFGSINTYLDVWWAPLTGAVTGLVVTATSNTAVDDCGITAFGVIHANPTTPFDDGGSTGLPSSQAASGSGEVTTATITAAAKDLIFCYQGKASSGSPGTPTSFTSIATASTSSGIKWWFDRTATMGAPSGFTGTVTSSGMTSQPGGMAVFALVAD
jgi:hypothetical protein